MRQEDGNDVVREEATEPTEFYENIYMSAIFYRALNAGSRSVPQWRGGHL